MIEERDRSGGRSPAEPLVGGGWESGALELEDSLGPEVQALLDGGDLRDDLG